MTRHDNKEVIEQLLERIRLEFAPESEKIIQAIVETVGGMRLTFPDLHDLHRAGRNKRIKEQFTGNNHEELANRHRLKTRQVRRILGGK